MAERDPAEALAHDVAGRGPARSSEVEPGLRVHVRVAPTVEDDAGDVAPRVEAGAAEEPRHLRADLPLVVGEALAEELAPPARPLLGDGQPGIVERHVEREDGRAVGVERRSIVADQHRPPDVAGEPEAGGPATRGQPQAVEETP